MEGLALNWALAQEGEINTARWVFDTARDVSVFLASGACEARCSG